MRCGLTFGERGMGGNTLRTWHIKFRGTCRTETVYINLAHSFLVLGEKL